MPTPSDTDLVRAARSDPAAFEALFDRHAARLRGWLMAQVGDLGVANDLLAETFCQAWLGRRRFRGKEPDEGAHWLYGIARNLLRQHYRRNRVETAGRRRLQVEVPRLEDGADEAISRIDAKAQRGRLRGALRELPPDQQEAIAYRVVGELSYRELAAVTTSSEQNARARVSRGLRTLKTMMNGVQP
jgi:RNA polymerase sigma factor (sigma-70 family)